MIAGNVVGRDLPELLVVSGTALESVERSYQGSLRREEENTVAGTLSWCLMLVRMMLVCVDLTSLQSLLINTLLLAQSGHQPLTSHPGSDHQPIRGEEIVPVGKLTNSVGPLVVRRREGNCAPSPPLQGSLQASHQHPSSR